MALATIGANLSAAHPGRVIQRMFELMGVKASGVNVRPTRSQFAEASGSTFRQATFFTKASGAPASNTAADAPTGKGDVIYDPTNSAFYICTAYADQNTFTLVKFLG